MTGMGKLTFRQRCLPPQPIQRQQQAARRQQGDGDDYQPLIASLLLQHQLTQNDFNLRGGIFMQALVQQARQLRQQGDVVRRFPF